MLSGTRERGLGRRLKRNKPWTSHHPGSQALRGEGGLPRLGSSVGTEPASQFPQWEEMGEKGPEKEKGHPHEGPRRRAGSPSPPSSSLCKTERKPYPYPHSCHGLQMLPESVQDVLVSDREHFHIYLSPPVLWIWSAPIFLNQPRVVTRGHEWATHRCYLSNCGVSTVCRGSHETMHTGLTPANR